MKNSTKKFPSISTRARNVLLANGFNDEQSVVDAFIGGIKFCSLENCGKLTRNEITNFAASLVPKERSLIHIEMQIAVLEGLIEELKLKMQKLT